MRKVLTVLRLIGIGVLAVIVLIVLVAAAGRGFHAAKMKILTDNSVQKCQYIEIGGVKQYIQVRGEDMANPVMLVLHGGPGSPMSFYSYYWQKPLENDYTIVQWDQRGSGRTYYANEAVAGGPAFGTMLSDLDALVDSLRETYGQEKIIILGHSWGTVLGSTYALEHPEKVAAYIGVGQVVDGAEGDRMAAETAAGLAAAAGDEKAAAAIRSAYEQFASRDSVDMAALMRLRALTSTYLPSGDNMPPPAQLWMGLTSPSLGVDDVRWYLFPMTDFDGYTATNQRLLDFLFLEGGFNAYEQGLDYAVPAYFISGDSDWITPYELVDAYFASISAPVKDMVTIADAGHSPFLDQPETFCAAVKAVLAP